ncbi:MAG: response regulator [Chloroflexi bacterium]|nr:response regulator [Chloroflexota bacterium]
MVILLVDDNQTVRQYIKTIINSVGPQAEIVEADSTTAKNHIDHPDLHLIVIDMDMRMMPNRMSATELIRYIKQHRPDIEIIALSDYATTIGLRTVLLAGAKHLFDKSLETDKFIETLHHLLDIS